MNAEHLNKIGTPVAKVSFASVSRIVSRLRNTMFHGHLREKAPGIGGGYPYLGCNDRPSQRLLESLDVGSVYDVIKRGVQYVVEATGE